MAEVEWSFTVDKKVLEQIRRNLPENIGRFMDKEAEFVVNDIKQSFGTSPAPANEPPGVDTGNLRNSIGWERDGNERRLITAGAEYAVYLELGSTRHGFVWPFMKPALVREERVFAEHARQEGLVK